MRSVFKVLIFVFLVLVLVEGALIAYLLTGIQSIQQEEVKSLKEQAQIVISDLKNYANMKNAIRSQFPVAPRQNWDQRIQNSVSEAGVNLGNYNKTPAQALRGTDAQVIKYDLDVLADSMKSLYEVASMLEQIDESGSVRVTNMNIMPRRTEDSPYSCSIEVTVYEQAVQQPESSPSGE